jgi:hypothetical protein
VIGSGRYRSRFCIARPAEVECTIRSLPLTILYCALCGGEWQDPVAAASGSVTTRQPDFSDINSMREHQYGRGDFHCLAVTRMLQGKLTVSAKLNLEID